MDPDTTAYKIVKYRRRLLRLLQANPSLAANITDPLVRKELGL